MNINLLAKLGLSTEDFEPRPEMQPATMAESIVTLQDDTNTLADTVLALCDLIEGGEE